MLILQQFSLVFLITIENSFSAEYPGVIKEKLYTQFIGVVNYILGIEELKAIEEDVSFNLYTRYNPHEPQILPVHSKNLTLSHFDLNRKTYFIMHGYTDHKDRSIIKLLRKAIVDSENANVFVVDWQRLAGLIYFNAVNSTVAVGHYLGEFLSLLEANSVDLGNVHLIGHSLGAHIAGVAGRMTEGRVGRITGLDPAGPLFESIIKRTHEQSLDKSDALFVDVIHTNGQGFGIMKAVGHADFYPNEGTSPQPGCTNIVMMVSCSHTRSVQFYAESINGEMPFKARHCRLGEDEDCANELPVHMGHHVSTMARGVYYLETNPDPPYAIDEDSSQFMSNLL